MALSDYIGVRLEQAERAALERAARAERRSVSGMSRNIIATWLRGAGWLEPSEELGHHLSVKENQSNDGN